MLRYFDSRINVTARTGCVVKMKILLIVLLLVSLTLVYGLEDNCDELGGECVPLENCDVLIKLITNEREILNNHICGFDGIEARVCCPQPKWNKCLTPEGSLGTCISIKICSHLYEQRNSDKKEDTEYVRSLSCVGPARHSVCCNFTLDDNPDPPPGLIRDATNRYSTDCNTSNLALGFDSLDDASNERTKCCGIEASSKNKITGGNKTAIDEYPWLAMLEYERVGACGGTLISSLFVLTAAHCLVGADMKSRGVYAVRLGEYNTTNQGKDCIEVEGGGEDCTDGPITITIKKMIVHPDYGSSIIYQANDIGLLRLNNSAPYTDFIRPICLPSSDVTKAALSSDLMLYAVGWGEVGNSRYVSPVKLHVALPVVDQKICEEQYSWKGESIIWYKQLCAGGIQNKDTCQGDSGGPLIYSDNESDINQIVGISSFGTAQCGLNRPSVFTKVIEYVPWIVATTKDFS